MTPTKQAAIAVLNLRQGRQIFKIMAAMLLFVSLGHLLLGSNPWVVLMGTTATLLSLLPFAYFGIFNLASVLMALVGFRYVGFPLFVKLTLGQPLDTNLLEPKGSFGLVLLGIIGYLAAFMIATRLSVGRPLLQPTSQKRFVGRISTLAAVIGIVANSTVAWQASRGYTGVTIANFFVSFLYLALISSTARVMLSSNLRKSLNIWGITLLIIGFIFALTRNSRMAIVDTFLCVLVTVLVFGFRIRWMRLIIMSLLVGLLVVYITPVFLYLRGIRSELSGVQRIEATVDIAINRRNDAVEAFQDYEKAIARDTYGLGGALLYYGTPQNILDRVSYINVVDIFKARASPDRRVGIEDLRLAVARAMPSILTPNKPQGFGHGNWLYKNIEILNQGSHPTVPLIGAGYLSFGWFGAFLYPLLLATPLLMMIKKISGFNLQNNIWAIYILLRIHNLFVEGASDAYIVLMLRFLPQDLVLIWGIIILGKMKFVYQSYRK